MSDDAKEVKRSVVLPEDLDDWIEETRLNARPRRILRSPFIVTLLYKVKELVDSGKVKL